MQWTLKIGMVLELGEPKTSRQILVFVVVVVLVCWRHRRRRESRDKLTARVGKHPPHCHSAFSEEACRVAAAYIPRSSDVFIVTAPKTGTTFLQMLCHCVRTQGLTDFQDIYQVSPWDQLAWDLGQDLGDEPVSQPRLFKSHLRLASINRGAKYICLVRRPEDVFRSWWRFLRDKDVPPLQTYKSISEFVFDKDYVAEGMRFGASLWEYYVEFYKCIDLPEVLVLCYEDLQESVAGHLDLISTFLSCAPLSHEVTCKILQEGHGLPGWLSQGHMFSCSVDMAVFCK